MYEVNFHMEVKCTKIKRTKIILWSDAMSKYCAQSYMNRINWDESVRKWDKAYENKDCTQILLYEKKAFYSNVLYNML